MPTPWPLRSGRRWAGRRGGGNDGTGANGREDRVHMRRHIDPVDQTAAIIMHPSRNGTADPKRYSYTNAANQGPSSPGGTYLRRGCLCPLDLGLHDLATPAHLLTGDWARETTRLAARDAAGLRPKGVLLSVYFLPS